MHRLGRPVHAVTIALITTLSVACATDQPVPVAPDHAHSANDVRSVLARDIANVKWELASNAFSRDLDPGDAPHIEQRRDTVQAMLTKLEAERLDPIGLPASFDVVTDSVSPLCFLSGNLNGCFIFATNTISMAGTGHVSDLTSAILSHSAVVAVTVDNAAAVNISVGGVGFSIAGYSFERDFSYGAPDCNVSAHSVASTATHNLSFGLSAGIASLMENGAQNSSSPPVSCAYKGLTVTASPPSIGRNQYSTITVTGLQECTTADATSSNTGVVIVEQANASTFIAFPQDAGPATITATCGTQRGSTSITVTAPDSTCDAAATLVGGAHAYDACSSSGDGTTGGGTTQDCGWYEWEISYDGGQTWSPDGEPFWYCPDGSQGATAIGRTQAARTGIVSKTSYKVSIFGTVISGPQSVLAYRDLKARGEPVIVVDTTRATPIDLEAVLQALAPVSHFSADTSATTGRMSAMTKPRSAVARARAAGEDAQLLQNLLNAKVVDIKGIGSGRLLEATVVRSSP